MSCKSHKRSAAKTPTVEQIQAHDLLDIAALCIVVGGTKPVSKATVYRLVKSGRLPPPIHVSPNIRRWVRGAVVSAMTSGTA